MIHAVDPESIRELLADLRARHAQLIEKRDNTAAYHMNYNDFAVRELTAAAKELDETIYAITQATLIREPTS